MGLRLSGLSSGLDTQALIDSILSVERLPLQRAEQRKADIEAQKSIFLDINTRLLALRDSIRSFDNLSTLGSGLSVDEEFLAYAATSSDDTAVSAVSTDGATPGTYAVEVGQLASVAREVTTAFSSDTDIIANAGDTLSIDFGGANPIDITVGAAGASLVDLRGLINSDVNNEGAVRADVIFDGVGHRLVIQGTQTGADNDIVASTTISGEASQPFFDAPLSQDGLDAELTVFGVPITRSSNSISDALPGVALTLRATTIEPVEVQVARDDEAIGGKVQTFVDAFNEVMAVFNEHARFDVEAETGGVLVGDSTIRSIEQVMQRAVVQSAGFAQTIGSLADIGISIGEDGRLDLDTDRLTEALDTDTLGVRSLMSGEPVVDGIPEEPADGPLVALVRDLERFLEVTTIGMDSIPSVLTGRDEGYQDRIDALDRQIENLERRLERREEFLILQFTQLETSLAQLQNQGNSLSALVRPDQ